MKEIKEVLDRITETLSQQLELPRSSVVKLLSIGRTLIQNTEELEERATEIAERLQNALGAYQIAKLQYDQAVNRCVALQVQVDAAEISRHLAQVEFNQAMAAMADQLEREREQTRKEGKVSYETYRRAARSRRAWMEALHSVFPPDTNLSVAEAAERLKELLEQRFREGQLEALRQVRNCDPGADAVDRAIKKLENPQRMRVEIPD